MVFFWVFVLFSDLLVLLGLEKPQLPYEKEKKKQQSSRRREGLTEDVYNFSGTISTKWPDLFTIERNEKEGANTAN